MPKKILEWHALSSVVNGSVIMEKIIARKSITLI
jgi:hypothetical protein